MRDTFSSLLVIALHNQGHSSVLVMTGLGCVLALLCVRAEHLKKQEVLLMVDMLYQLIW